ncbi:GFA family protein [Aliikangiella maris]|uniref:GFA family protein n=2 Tax=Aliikangiella maris TaxID=3162458 RepID=A0ABV3MN73_9GAMM
MIEKAQTNENTLTHNKLMNKILSGGCHCGAIRYIVTGEAIDSDYCHCHDCQKSVGAVAVTWCDFKSENCQWLEGKVKEYQSSDNIFRGFCENCGTSLTYRHKDYPQFTTIASATLDDPNRVAPKYHIHTASQPDWLVIDDALDKYPHARS